MTQLPPLTLIIGAAASGKSIFAENLVSATGRPRTYIATAQAHDAEMVEKIERHLAQRGKGWTTVEAPLDLCAPLRAGIANGVILLDCVTLWLSNHLLNGSLSETLSNEFLDALADCQSSVVIVTNEVGASGVPENALARQFRNENGKLNQRLAARASLVVLVAAGLPMVIKGTLPDGDANTFT